MQAPATPDNEESRLRALHALEILDTLPEQVFDDLVGLAAHICDVPIALVSLVDTDRQWFKARYGLDATETPREVSFCGHVVADGEMLVVPDAHADGRFSDNPLVTSPPSVRFYAGAPLIVDGHTFGTLCAIDNKPRELGEEQVRQLRALARQTVSQLQMRLELRRHEATLVKLRHAQSQARVRDRFFDLTLDMLCIAGFDGYFKQLNPAWTRVLGHTDAELLAAPFMELIHPGDRVRTQTETAKLVTGNYESVDFENRFRHTDGTYRSFLWSATVDPESEMFVAVARDVTEEKRNLRELELARELADAANRTKSAFLANMSHELRTPLNSVIGFTSVMMRNKKGNLEEKELRYLERISANGRHLLSLINDVLDVAKIEAGRMEINVELGNPIELLHAVAEQLEGRAETTQNVLRVVTPTAVEPVSFDRHRMTQVLINLAGNALKFTSDGVVELRLVSATDDTRRAVRIEVADTGIGIPEAERETIFQPFHQTESGRSRTFEGTGLGLSIARVLAQKQGFELGLVSEVDEGSTFYLELVPGNPALEHRRPESGDATTPTAHRSEPAVQPGEVPVPGPARASGRRMVLVIDDDLDSRALMETYLEDLGCDVICTGDAERGLAIASSTKPDLITVDLRMPGMGGAEFLRRVSDHPKLRSIPVLVCSVVATEHASDLTAAAAVLQKPVEREGLQEAMTNFLPGVRKADVLVVEDDPGTRLQFSDMLERMGFTPHLTENGEEAMRFLGEKRPDAVILDLAMPQMDGFQVLSKIRLDPSLASVPVVVCTAANAADVGDALRFAAQAIVEKGPDAEQRLRTLLTELIET